MIRVISDDIASYRKLVQEYEDSLPPDLQHSDLALDPDVALVAMQDDAPCGCAALTAAEGAAQLRHLYVHPEFRNRGVARALMSAFADAARDRGFTRIILDTDREQLPAAYALYRSLGFAECAPHTRVDYGCPTFMELML